MGHGLGGTRDTGLLGYAEAFAEAGIDTFLFDYSDFGASDGTPRQAVSVRRQRQDYHAAVAAARDLPGVDPDRIALWGYSLACGHVIAVAAQDARVAAIVSMAPLTDGLAGGLHVMRHAGARHAARLAWHGLRDIARALTRHAPLHVPMVGEPGSVALICIPGAAEFCTANAGPTWRNEVRARFALKAGLNRPTIYARRLRRPILVQVGTNDQAAAPGAARRSAKKAGQWAQLREYPVNHFDIFQDPWLQKAGADQIDFLSRVPDP